jgi:hypothetical protein
MQNDSRSIVILSATVNPIGADPLADAWEIDPLGADLGDWSESEEQAANFASLWDAVVAREERRNPSVPRVTRLGNAKLRAERTRRRIIKSMAHLMAMRAPNDVLGRLGRRLTIVGRRAERLAQAHRSALLGS